MIVFGQKLLYSGNVVVFGHCGCIRAKSLYSGKRCCIQVKELVFGQKLLYSGKVVVIRKFCLCRQSGCILAKVVVFGKK